MGPASIAFIVVAAAVTTVATARVSAAALAAQAERVRHGGVPVGLRLVAASHWRVNAASLQPSITNRRNHHAARQSQCVQGPAAAVRPPTSTRISPGAIACQGSPCVSGVVATMATRILRRGVRCKVHRQVFVGKEGGAERVGAFQHVKLREAMCPQRLAVAQQ